MNVIDRFIGFFNPSAGIERQLKRIKLDRLRKHDMGGHTRRHPPESNNGSTARSSVSQDIATLRTRSSWMLENNGPAAQAQRVYANNVVGTGIRPSVRSLDKSLEKKILEYWRDWAEDSSCDFEEHDNFYGLQSAVMRTVFERGAAIVRRRRTKSGKLELLVQEGDYLDLHKNEPTKSGGYIHDGIEFDASGKVVSYWLFDTLDSDNMREYTLVSKRIPATDVLHIFYKHRAGAHTGLPFLRQAYMALKDADEYRDTEIVGKTVQGSHAAFITNSDASSILETSTEEPEIQNFQPGGVYHLPHGKSVTFSGVQHSQSYKDFMRQQGETAAAGLGVTYASFSGDYSSYSFSSSKSAWNDTIGNFREIQNRVMLKFNNGVWKWFIESLVIRGLVQPPAENIKADWTPPRREMIQPKQEVDAIKTMLSMGLISYSEAVRSLGGDPDDVTAEMQKDLENLEKIGFVASFDSAKMAKAKTVGKPNLQK